MASIYYDLNDRQSIIKLFNRIATSYWFGATDTKLEGTWRWWTDNTVMSIGDAPVNSTISWSAGYPAGGASYNCLYWDSTNNRVHDGYCAWSFYYFCEHPSMNLFYSLDIIRISFWNSFLVFQPSTCSIVN